jgi:hypothetical protein
MKQLRGSRLLAVTVAGTLAATGLSTVAAAAPAPGNAVTAQATLAVSPVQAIKDDLNQQLLRALQDAVARRVFVDAIVRGGQVDLLTVLAASGSTAGTEFSRYAVDANQQVISLKGLDGIEGSILQGRLADPAMAQQLSAGVAPLLAASPADDKAKTFTAYGLDGRQVELEIATMATVPVVLVELDDEKITPVGLSIVSAEFNRLGFASELQVGGSSTGRATSTGQATSTGVVKATGGVSTMSTYTATRMDQIWLTYDEEPWVKGGAEIYGLVLGQGKDGKGRADVINMQYLDYDHQWYYPGQQLINWSNFKWNAVDLLLMEQDDSTNYKAIAKTVVNAVVTAVGGAAYVPLISAVLDAFPDGWFTDEDDYVDSFYMLNSKQNGYLWGAAHNAKIKVTPVVVTTS